MIRTFKYPLRPTVVQANQLVAAMAVCGDLYNAALQERREAWRLHRKFVTLNEQCAHLKEIRRDDPSGAGAVAHELLQTALERVDFAYRGFFRRLRNGDRRPGYPRFRRHGSYRSVSISRPRINGAMLNVPNVGQVRFHKYRGMRGLIKEARVKLSPTGKWWVSFVCDVGDGASSADLGRYVGLDMGLNAFLVTSSGESTAPPKVYRLAERRLASHKRALMRKTRGSRSYERQRQILAREHARCTNRRLDFARKLAKSIVDRHDVIVHEDLNIKGMRLPSLNKSINDAGWGVFIACLNSKAEEAGKQVIAVNPSGTTATCSGCGAVEPKSLDQRVHECGCGLRLDRDHNAARNILSRGLREARNRSHLVAEPTCLSELEAVR